ncbi:MAG: cyclase family protein [bacterium]
MGRFYDVTIPITDGMIVYPGDREVRFKRTHFCEKEGYNWSEIECGTHIGTHIDAPLHFVAGGKSLDDFPLDLMVGEALVVEIGSAMIDRATLQKSDIGDWRVLFFKTRNQALWKLDRFSEEYVSLTADAAEYLVEKGTQLVGIDYRSIEAFEAPGYPVHNILLGSGAFIIEGLYLNDVAPGRYRYHCLPMKLAKGDGGPARVILEQI